MADTTVDNNVLNTQDVIEGSWGPYYLNTTTGISVFVDANSDLAFRRTTDGGVGWGSKTVVEAGTVIRVAVWFDQETPGDAGTLLHVTWMDDAADEVKYVTIDVSSGTAGTIRTVDAGVTISSTTNVNRLAITKARDGTIVVAFLTPSEIECYKSSDNFATAGTDIADPFEATNATDHLLLFSANVDDGDVAGLYWDRSANEISIKMYDDSADTWTETAILGSMADDASHINMDGSVRHSDGLILGCAHSNDDNNTDDLRTFTVNPNSIASPTIDTTTANVFTNQGESAQCCLHINQQNDNVRIAYLKGGTWQTDVDAVYHLSDDDMATWGSEQAYSEQPADDFRRITGPRTTGDNGGFFQPLWFNDDNGDIFVNLPNDVAIAPAAAAEVPYQPWMQRAPILAQ